MCFTCRRYVEKWWNNMAYTRCYLLCNITDAADAFVPPVLTFTCRHRPHPTPPIHISSSGSNCVPYFKNHIFCHWERITYIDINNWRYSPHTLMTYEDMCKIRIKQCKTKTTAGCSFVCQCEMAYEHFWVRSRFEAGLGQVRIIECSLNTAEQYCKMVLIFIHCSNTMGYILWIIVLISNKVNSENVYCCRV